MNFWCKNEQAACGVLLRVVYTLQVVYLVHEFMPLKFIFWQRSHQVQSYRVCCGWSFK